MIACLHLWGPLNMEKLCDATPGSHTDYQQLFTAVILQQSSPSAAQLQADNAADTAVDQQGSLQACLRNVLLEELLRVGTDTTALQAVLSGCAAAVLRVCQSLQGPLQQQLLQASLQAMQEVPELLLHSTRDFQLLQLVQGASRDDVQPQQAGSTTDWFQACPEAAALWGAVTDMVDCQPVGYAAL